MSESQLRIRGHFALTGQANTQSDKEYRQKNKGKIKEQRDRYKEKHRAEVNDRRKDKRWREGYSLSDRFHGGRQCAKKRGVSFSLTFDEYAAIAPLPCYYCGGLLGGFSRAGLGSGPVGK